MNEYGFRGDSVIVPKPKEEYRIFMVGGSTTECLYIDDSLAVNKQLQDRLLDKNAKVYGAGKSGDDTPDHLAMIGHRILHLDPDMIVLFCGINDLRSLNNGYDFTHRNTFRQAVHHRQVTGSIPV